MMKPFIYLSTLLIGLIPSLGWSQDHFDRGDSISYSLGVLIGSNLKNQGFTDLNAEAFTKGLMDVAGDKELSIDREQANLYIAGYFEAEASKANAKAQQVENEFLVENGKREGVVRTESGLQYEIIESGQGNTPGIEDRVTVHYTGTLLDGSKFDSSRDRGQPATFPVNGVIAGWTEALQLMKEGDRWILYIPYNLAYGERGAGEVIPPFATLVFDVELIGINE
jgi:FKBP-type peptidyl-prolyl cis-trans isomerase FklB